MGGRLFLIAGGYHLFPFPMQLDRSIDIAAPPEVVWAVWSDVTRWPEWTAGVAHVELLAPGDAAPGGGAPRGGPLSVGARVRIRQPWFPTAVWQVIDIEPGRGFTWVATSPGARVTGFHRIEARRDWGSRATMGLRFDGPVARVVAWLTRARTERNLDLEAAGLARRSETMAASSFGGTT